VFLKELTMKANDNLSVKQLIEYGIRLVQDNQPPAARKFFEQALERDPRNVTALLWLAGLGDSGEDSLRFIVRALEIDPKNERAHAALRWARKRARSAPPAADTQPSAPIPLPIRPQPIVGPQKERSGAKGASLLLGLFAMVLVLGGGFAVAGLGQPNRAVAVAQVAPTDVVATPTLPLIATATATPTSTPWPTSTPLPTATSLPTATPSPTATPVPPTETSVPPTATPYVEPPPAQPGGNGERWIDVDLTQQRLVAYEGNTPVHWVTVSTGLPGTPTVTGQFSIYVKYTAQLMVEPGYYLPDVPWVMYFYEGYELHGTYWHNNFGHPVSHGCVNLPTPEAKWLYDWASVGTLVNIHY
jgi:lipoprotein-anchoring transpeptidase ErfK/SrfK